MRSWPTSLGKLRETDTVHTGTHTHTPATHTRTDPPRPTEQQLARCTAAQSQHCALWSRGDTCTAAPGAEEKRAPAEHPPRLALYQGSAAAMNLNGRKRSGLLMEDMLLLTSQNLPRLEVKDNYSIVRELGSGSYGQVLLAVHHTQGTPMALKFLRKSSTELRTFLIEYCVSLSLSAHPCIIGTFGIAFQTESHYVFAQELAVASDLFSIMKPQIGVPEMTVKRCALQISSALEYMDTKGLVHRDIKPENILLFDHDCRQVKLTDFGLTCANGTSVESMPENLPYTAPEMCILGESDKLIAHASLDVWAFGVLLFCVLTGYFPWNNALPSDKHYLDYTRWHRSSRIFQLPTQWKWFSTEALEMFKKMLAPEPTQRCSPKEVMNYLKKPWKAVLQNRNSNRVDNSRYLQQGKLVNKNFLVQRGR